MALRELGVLVLWAIICAVAQVQPDASFYKNYDYFYEGGALVKFADYRWEDGLNEHQEYSVSCGKNAMKVVLPSSTIVDVTLLGSSEEYAVLEDTEACGYFLTKEHEHNVLHVSFSACHVTTEEGRYTVRVQISNDVGPAEVATVSCDPNCNLVLSQKRIRRSQPSYKCSMTPMTRPTFSPRRRLPQNYTKSGCSIPNSQRLACGPSGTTAAECLKKGCCLDSETSTCYYSMDECTADGRFVFSVYYNVTSVPVSPKSLVVGTKHGCKPVRANKEFAVFRFRVNECGTISYRIGETTIYMAEVRTIIRAHNLRYGVITRDHPVRLMMECRYTKVGPSMARASTGYMVMTPNLPSVVRSEGLFGVQLRIANDETFTTFSSNHLPLNVLLGKPLYLEVRLNSAKPEATLLVHYCVAYPRSAKNALILLYEGCPNALDSDQTAILYTENLAQNRHRRRFEVKAFQFMDQSTNKYHYEEIYFMCSTEVCLPSATPCRETCFDGKS